MSRVVNGDTLTLLAWNACDVVVKSVFAYFKQMEKQQPSMLNSYLSFDLNSNFKNAFITSMCRIYLYIILLISQGINHKTYSLLVQLKNIMSLESYHLHVVGCDPFHVFCFFRVSVSSKTLQRPLL